MSTTAATRPQPVPRATPAPSDPRHEAPTLAGMEALLTAVLQRPVRLRVGRGQTAALRLTRLAA